MIAFWTKDPAQIDRIFRLSGLMRGKWDERHSSDGRTYGEMTIAKAIEFENLNYVKCEFSENYNLDHETPDSLELDPRALQGFAGKFVELATRYSEGDPAAVLGHVFDEVRGRGRTGCTHDGRRHKTLCKNICGDCWR